MDDMTIQSGQADPLVEAATHSFAETVLLLMLAIPHGIVKVDVLSEPRSSWVLRTIPSQSVLLLRGGGAFSEEVGESLVDLRDPLNGMLLKTFHD